jgi:AcrR family transcriptional regulator
MQATKKGEQTREMILERAAQLFSLKGYFGSSMSDLAQETGLGKSGFYNHFQSKDDLALQAFDYAAAEMSKRFQQALEGKPNAIERLQALLEVFQGIADHPFLAGGCHLLNTAIESDDAHPALRERAIKSADKWQAMLQAIVRKGIERGEVRPEISAEDFATIFIATVEGAEMLNKLYGDPVHMRRAIAFLGQYIETQLKPTS